MLQLCVTNCNAGALFTSTGPCVVNGSCVARHAYNHDEACVITAVASGFVSAPQFETEKCCDKLTFGANTSAFSELEWSGIEGPANVPVVAGDTFRWSTDRSFRTNSGWSFCMSQQPTATFVPTAAPTTSSHGLQHCAIAEQIRTKASGQSQYLCEPLTMGPLAPTPTHIVTNFTELQVLQTNTRPLILN